MYMLLLHTLVPFRVRVQLVQNWRSVTNLPLVFYLTWRALCQQPSQVMLQDKQRDGKIITYTMYGTWWKWREILLLHYVKIHRGFPGIPIPSSPKLFSWTRDLKSPKANLALSDFVECILARVYRRRRRRSAIMEPTLESCSACHLFPWYTLLGSFLLAATRHRYHTYFRPMPCCHITIHTCMFTITWLFVCMHACMYVRIYVGGPYHAMSMLCKWVHREGIYQGPTFCPHGRPFGLHGRPWAQNVGLWHIWVRVFFLCSRDLTWPSLLWQHRNSKHVC